VEVIQLLLESGANVGVRDENGRTALHLAGFRGKEAVVLLLLKNGADISEPDCEGRAALHHAIEWKGREVWDWNEEGATALHRAAMGGDTVVVQLLLDAGLDMRIVYFEERTALQRAADRGKAEVVRVLLENGADVNERDLNERTILHDAVEQRGNDAVVQLLLGEGADVRARDGEGRTALHRTVWQGGEAVVRLLLENGADASACDNYGRTVLDEATAVLKGVEAVENVLLEAETNVGNGSDEEQMALVDAVGKGKGSVVRLLLKQGADSSVRDCKGRSALDDAVAMLEGVQVVAWHLRERMADVKAQGREERSVLRQLGLVQKGVEAMRRADKGIPALSAAELRED
jgi:ankyrin repeat protein